MSSVPSEPTERRRSPRRAAYTKAGPVTVTAKDGTVTKAPAYTYREAQAVQAGVPP